MKIDFDKVLTTGAGGMVGKYVDFGIRADHRSLDITDLEKVLSTCRNHQPQVVLHLAALTDMNLCEKDPALAYKVNILGTYNVALNCRDNGIKLIYLSTGAVFDGKQDSFGEDTPPHPLNVYGRTKYAGELIVRDMVPNHIIVRTGWLFGGGRENDKRFVGKIMKKIETGEEIQAIHDHFGSPTYIKDLVGEIKKLIEADYAGIFHIVNSDKASYFDLAGEISKILGVEAKINAVPASQFSESVPRAVSEVMISKKLIALRSWQQALKEYIKGEWQG